jgi:hypothetical protein
MSIITTAGAWIAFAPKAGLTTMHQYVGAGLAELDEMIVQHRSQRTTIICRDPLLRAISIYHYNMITMPYNNRYNQAIADANDGKYNSLYDAIRSRYPQPSTRGLDAERFLYWIDQVLPNTIHTDGHTISQTKSWRLPTGVQWRDRDIQWWCLQNLNQHLLQEFGWVPQQQNRQAYHRKRALKYLELEGVRDAIYTHYAEDFEAYETALQQQCLR